MYWKKKLKNERVLLETVNKNTNNKDTHLNYTVIFLNQTGNLKTVGSIDGTCVFLREELYLSKGVFLLITTK